MKCGYRINYLPYCDIDNNKCKCIKKYDKIDNKRENASEFISNLYTSF